MEAKEHEAKMAATINTLSTQLGEMSIKLASKPKNDGKTKK